MVTNKLLSNSIASVILGSQEIADKVTAVTNKPLFVIEGMNLAELDDNSNYIKEYGAIITIDPIGRDDKQQDNLFQLVINVNFINSGEIFKNNATITETSSHKVYNGFFDVEEVVLDIIKELKDIQIDNVNFVKIDYEMPPIQEVSNNSFYTCFISINAEETLNIGSC